MEFICQKSTVAELQSLADSDRHSILIEGPEGSGKTYLAKQYASMIGIRDFQICIPKVDAIKECTNTCLQLDTPIVLCIENLDLGVPAASYALLKILEEPSPNLYILITCRNINRVPDTIISRSAVIIAAPPVDIDISSYSLNKNSDRFKEINQTPLWNCVRTFHDADTVLNMTTDQFLYFETLREITKFNDSVSNIVWNLGHYSDNAETPLELVIRYIMEIMNTPYIHQKGIECIRDMAEGRVAKHAVLAKFAFECKYCE